MIQQQQIRAIFNNDETFHPILICVLGHFHIVKAGQIFPMHHSGKVEALLSHLSVAYQDGITRDLLLQMFWPNVNSNLASQSLHSLVYSIHKLIGDAIDGSPVVYRHGKYRLNFEAGVVSDVACFDHMIRMGERQLQQGEFAAASHSYRCAAELYRGELCIDTDVHTLIERERLRARYLMILVYLAQYHYTAGEYDACLEYAWRLLACDPCREDAYRIMMCAYVRRGERTEALHRYHLCAEVLRREYDAAPEPATTALFEQIRLDPDSV